MTDFRARRHRKRRHPVRAGLLASFCVHVLLALSTLTGPVVWFLGAPGSARPPSITVVAASPEDLPAAEAVRLVTDPSRVRASMVLENLERRISEADDLSEDQKREHLEQLGRRLESISSEESIDELSSLFQGWLGTAPRATRPAPAPPPGPFDFDTAQLHDVLREPVAEGGWRYWSILLDAEGRTLAVPMDPQEGESLYKTMQRLKAFPLAEKIYRQITMPLLDKLIAASRKKAGNRKHPDGLARERGSEGLHPVASPPDELARPRATGGAGRRMDR